MALDAAPIPFGQFEFGQGREEASRGPALPVGLLGEVGPEPGDGGEPQLAQEQFQACGVDGGAGGRRPAHATPPGITVQSAS